MGTFSDDKWAEMADLLGPAASDWDSVARVLGPENAAMLRQNNNVPTEGATMAQTPVSPQQAPQGALAAAAQPQMSAAPPELAALMGEMKAERERQFTAGQQRIEQMYGGPSQTQQLWALAQALLSPTPYRGFAGSMYNVSRALGGISEQQAEAEQKRKEALLNLQNAYSGGLSSDRMKELELRYGLAEKDAEARARVAKEAEKGPRTGFNPVTGELVNMETGAPIEEPEPAVGMTRTYKGRTFRFVGGDRYDKANWQEVR